MRPEPLSTTVVGGFLGAGKTTLVNHLLRNAGGRRIMVMVNDFGESPIDRDLIVGGDGDVLALANGCACCSTGGDLLRAVSWALDQAERPDHLLIEASGVADPDRMADIARAEPDLALNGVVVVVDSRRIADQIADARIGRQVADQLAGADLLILNKADGADADQVGRTLKALAPRAAMAPAVYGEAPIDLVLGELAPRKLWRAVAAEQPSHETAFVRWAAAAPAIQTFADLENALQSLPTNLLRLKGFVPLEDGRRMLVQAGFGWREISLAPGDRRGLVAIGLPSLDLGLLDRLFAHPARS